MPGGDGPPRRTGGLSWGLRFEGPHDPETLIAVDLAEALAKAHERALACQCSASLWRNGRRLAEIPSRSLASNAAPSRELLEQLAAAGWYVVGGPEETDFNDFHASSVASQADRIESR
ncbi:hypothetical protein ACO2Q1_02450 [Brevundimonas sp. VNH65]|uniref:hypothetical protein n=1 Tax=Brevundimonas sp. VNH65 TaxID=3400917 RepID=UPI003BFE116C